MKPLVSFSILGSGSSSGVPWLNCIINRHHRCQVCDEAEKNGSSKNNRNNVSALFSVRRATGTPAVPVVSSVLVDTGKTLRDMLLRMSKYHPTSPLIEGLNAIKAILLTHSHADAVMGLDDVRDLCSKDSTMPIYLTLDVYNSVKTVFPYLCSKRNTVVDAKKKLYIASIEWRIITPFVPFVIPEAQCIVVPIPVRHAFDGSSCMAFEFGYLSSAALTGSFTDTSSLGYYVAGTEIPDEIKKKADEVADSMSLNVTEIDETILSEVDTCVDCAGSGGREDELPRILYISDIKMLSCESRSYIRSKKTSLLVLDCLNRRFYPTHMGLSEVANYALDHPDAAKIRLIGMNHRFDHELEDAAIQEWNEQSLHEAELKGYPKRRRVDMRLSYDGDHYEVGEASETSVENVWKDVRNVLRQVKGVRHLEHAVLGKRRVSPDSDFSEYTKADEFYLSNLYKRRYDPSVTVNVNNHGNPIQDHAIEGLVSLARNCSCCGNPILGAREKYSFPGRDEPLSGGENPDAALIKIGERTVNCPDLSDRPSFSRKTDFYAYDWSSTINYDLLDENSPTVRKLLSTWSPK